MANQGGNQAGNEGRNQSVGATSKRSFGSMDEDQQKEIASEGGKVSGGNFKHDPERASEAGKKGGKNSGGGNR